MDRIEPATARSAKRLASPDSSAILSAAKDLLRSQAARTPLESRLPLFETAHLRSIPNSTPAIREPKYLQLQAVTPDLNLAPYMPIIQVAGQLMDFPRQQHTFAWWQSHPSARVLLYAVLYTAVTMAIACPLSTLLYQSIRESLRLPYAETTILQLVPRESLLTFGYFLIFASIAEIHTRPPTGISKR